MVTAQIELVACKPTLCCVWWNI